MSDLLSLLSLGSTAIAANNAGIAVATNNVANVNTDGYSRERVELSSLLPSPGVDGVGGVQAGATTRSADAMLATRIRAAAGNASGSQVQADGLSDLETTLAAAPTSDKLATLFASLDQLASAPGDKTPRDSVISALGGVIDSLHGAASAVATAKGDADQQVGTLSTQASSLAAQLAAANAAAQSGDPTALDNRDKLATQLAGLVGGSARVDPDGQIRFVLDGGAVLVDGTHAATMTTQKDPTTGLSNVLVSDGGGSAPRDVTAQLSGGQLGGAPALRGQITAVGAGYDQLATDLASSMNAVSTANAAPDGTTGHALFAPTTSAATLALDPNLTSATLASAAPGAGPGDNTGALALFDVGNAKAATGGTRTLTDASLDVLAGLGQQSADAKTAAATDQTVSDHLSDLRDSLAGVDVNEEQTNLSRYESSVSALVKFVSTINDTMTSDLIENICA